MSEIIWAFTNLQETDGSISEAVDAVVAVKKTRLVKSLGFSCDSLADVENFKLWTTLKRVKEPF